MLRKLFIPLLLTVFMGFLLIPVSVFAQSVDIFVSILPQKYFVERIASQQVNVHVMVRPGQSPETFEPSPKLMAQYSSADIYFTIGMPFEQVWIKRLASLNDRISIVTTQPEEHELLHNPHQHKGSQHSQWDPHTWLSPMLAIQQAKIIEQALSRLLPDKKTLFENNYQLLKTELMSLDKSISQGFANKEKRQFLTFHPAFSYYAHRYGLIQRSIEINGKEPSAKQIAKLVAELSEKKVPYILIEQQFNTVISRTIARSLNAQLLSIDPLAYDYIKNMQDITDKVSRSLF